MKIVFVSQPLCSGGAERVVATMANEFDKLGHEVKIIVVDNGDENIYKTRESIEFIHIRKPENPVMDLLYRAWKIREYLNAYQPDVVLPFTTQKGVSVLLAALLSKHKVIVSERSNPRTDPTNKLLRILRKLLYWTADGFVFQTEGAREFFSSAIQKRSAIIPNPINESMIPAFSGVRSHKIVMVNRLDRAKNIEMAIGAMKKIRNTFPDYTLEIYGKSYAGEDAYENELKQLTKEMNLEDVILFKGFSPDVHEKIQDAQVFLLTSNYEGMSNALMEALALGIPCIATDDPNGGARALIRDGENGLLISVGDEEACSHALRKLLENPDLRDKFSKEGQKIRQQLAVSHIAQMWLQFIAKIIK